jgi:hypothetical protein
VCNPFEPRSVEIHDLDSDMERRLTVYVAETRAHDFVFVVDYGAKGASITCATPLTAAASARRDQSPSNTTFGQNYLR